jgi:hypothetical protein
MKKNLLLTIVSVISGIILVNAQCVPSGSCVKGICPDTITNLPTAHVSIPYSTFLTMVVPADTIYVGNTVPIDSLNFTSITGLPTGFTATPNKSGWPGSTKGCILISGTPTLAMQSLTYKLTINVTAHGKYMGFPVSLPITYTGYKIYVKDTTVGISNYEQNGISFISYSEQSNNSLEVKVHSQTEISNATIIINDITGRELLHLNNLNGTEFLVKKANLSKGIYMISVMTNEKLIARGKIIVG